jgi:hypothetical protein
VDYFWNTYGFAGNRVWWYYAVGARTTSALRERARQRGNVVIDNASPPHPGFSI